MKLPLRPVVPGFCWFLALSMFGFASLPGCTRHAPARPASALSEKDRTVLDRYEDIRAALASDDIRAVRRAGTALSAFLKTNPDAGLSTDAETISTAVALDKARQAFEPMSVNVVKLADGVQGFYVFDTPIPAGAMWVQKTADPDNPYAGRAMHDIGTLRK